MFKAMKSFICKGCLNPVTSTGRTSVDIGTSANLELVDTFCYLGYMLSVEGDADVCVGLGAVRSVSGHTGGFMCLITDRINAAGNAITSISLFPLSLSSELTNRALNFCM